MGSTWYLFMVYNGIYIMYNMYIYICNIYNMYIYIYDYIYIYSPTDMIYDLDVSENGCHGMPISWELWYPHTNFAWVTNGYSMVILMVYHGGKKGDVCHGIPNNHEQWLWLKVTHPKFALWLRWPHPSEHQIQWCDESCSLWQKQIVLRFPKWLPSGKLT